MEPIDIVDVLDLLYAAEHGGRVPRCGMVLRVAKESGLVTFSERGEPSVTAAGRFFQAEYSAAPRVSG